jgi:hypothetical protein
MAGATLEERWSRDPIPPPSQPSRVSGLVDGALAAEEQKRGVMRRSTAKAEPEAGAQKKMSDSNQPQVFVKHF